MSVSALPRENRTNEILLFYPMRYDYLINITYKKHILFTFLTFWLTFHPVLHFSAYSKIAWNAGPLCEHKHGDAFYARKQPCFQRVLAIAILSVRLSVHLSVIRVDQAKTVQARISKFSPSAAWKTLVSGTVKLFRKLKGDHPERGR